MALDLPGHGFSDPARGDGATLPGMARGVAALLRLMDLRPTVLVGHSAGAAIAVQMALDGETRATALDAPASIISLNGALLPLHGLAGQVFSPLAKLMASNRLVPYLFSKTAADTARVRRLVASTGSSLDEEGVALYGRLVSDPAHVAGALAMMAHWDLHALAARLPQLRTTGASAGGRARPHAAAWACAARGHPAAAVRSAAAARPGPPGTRGSAAAGLRSVVAAGAQAQRCRAVEWAPRQGRLEPEALGVALPLQHDAAKAMDRSNTPGD